MDQVRIGVIGTSWWADGFFLPVLSSYERANLVAVCGRNQGRAGEMAAKYTIPQVYSDYRRMIAEAGLDALVVASPDDLHYEMVMAALDAGLHVLGDKPLALNANHARQMLERAQTAGLKHLIPYTWRWLPQIQYIKALMDKGYLGRVYQANFRLAFAFLHSRDYAWRIDADRSNGVLGDAGSHMIDMARWLLGDVTRVSASLATHVEHDGVAGRPLNPANDSAFLILNFASAAQCSIQISFVSHMAEESGMAVSLYGEHGTLHTDWYFSKINFELRGARRDEDAIHPIDIPPEYIGGYQVGEIFAAYMTDSIGPRLFIDSILDDKLAEPNFFDGYKNQLVIDAALESQRSGRRITLTQDP